MDGRLTIASRGVIRFSMKYLLLIISLWVSAAYAETAKLTQDTQAVKQQVLQLNKDLYQLEKELLSPATTEISYYFSLRGVKDFQPLALEVKTEGIATVSHLYTEREVEALRMGAVHPVASNSIGPGLHRVEIIVRGKDKSGAERHITLNDQVEKQTGPLLLEIVVGDNQGAAEPFVQLDTWQ